MMYVNLIQLYSDGYYLMKTGKPSKIHALLY